MNKSILSGVLASVILLFAMTNGWAATITSGGSGNWNTGATWVGGSVPATTDTVIIAGGHTVTLTANVNQSGVVTVNTGGTLVCSAVLGIANNLNPGMVINGTVDITVNNGLNKQGGGNNPTVQVTSNGVVILSTTAASVGVTRWDFQSGSTVKLTASGNQTLDNSFIGLGIDNLILAGSGVKTLGENTAVSQLLSIQGTATLALGGRALTYGSGAALEYKGSAAQTVSTAEFPATLAAGVIINNTSGVTLTAVKTLNGNLTLTTGTFTLNSSLTLGAGVTITRDTGSLSAAPTFGAAVNVAYTGTAAVTTGSEIPNSATVLQNLTINKTGGVNLNGSAAVNGTLTLTGGAFAVGANTLTLNGPAMAGSPANLSTSASSSLSFGGSATGVTLPSSVTALNNLAINNTNGLTLNSSPSINTLTLTSGDITTGANAIVIANSSNTAITGGGGGSYVHGNLQKSFAIGNGQSFTFPIGDTLNYTPINLVSLNVTAGGSLKASTATTDHPQITTSGIDAAHSVNRVWTLTNSPGGIAVSAGTVTLNFVPGDVDSGSTTGNFVVRRYSVNWNTTTTGILGSTNSSASGLTAFGDFAVGDQLVNAVAFGQQPTGAAAGTIISPAVTVTATDILGVGASGGSVSLALTSGTGTLSGTTTQTANASGVATFNDLRINLPGTKQLTAASGSVSVLSSNFNITSPTAAWQYRQSITIYHANVFVTDQTNFAVLINLTNASLSAHAQASGNDILFTASDGATVLSYEREKYSSGTGTLVAWVKVPLLSHTTDTVLYMYYGNAGAADQQDPDNVWDANYKSVWHLKEATAATSADSTTNRNAATPTNSPTQTAGRIAGALSFNGINMEANVASTFGLGTNNVTMETWAYLSSTNLRGAFLKIGDTNSAPGTGYGFGVGGNGTGGMFENTNTGNQFLILYETTRWIRTGKFFGTGWHHVVVSIDGLGHPFAYLDGVQIYTDTLAAPLAPSNNLTHIGGYTGSAGENRHFNGILDEVRISSAVRSAGWIQTEYTNQASPSTFYLLGAEMTNGPTATVMTVTRTAGLKLLISLSDLATNWTDANGYTMTLTNFNLLSTNHVTVLTNSAWILYPNSANVNDQLRYGLVDSSGATNIGYINIIINPFATGQQTGSLNVTNGVITTKFYGRPGLTYQVQRTTSLSPPAWVDISTNTVDATGVISVTDSNAGSSAYYRLKWQP